MDNGGPAAAGVMDALHERLRVLALERDALAGRTRELEAALSATSAEAQRRAAEALHLQALIDFYEHEQPPDGAVGRGFPAPEQAGDGQRDETNLPPSPSIRRAAGSWTSAWRDAAVAALTECGAPLHYRELYRLVAARGFTFGGRSPEATFLASLHRNRSTFESAGKGIYWLVEAAPAEAPATAAPTRRRTRRPRPIGKAKGGT